MASACRWWQHCVAAALDSTAQQSSLCITQECPTLLQPCLTLQRRQPAQLLQLSTHAAPAEKLQPAAPCRLEATSALLQFVDIRTKAPCCQAPDRRLGCKQLGCQAPQIGLQRGSMHWLQTKGPCRRSCRTPTSPSTGLTEELPSDPCPERCMQAQLHNFAEVLGTQSCSSMSMSLGRCTSPYKHMLISDPGRWVWPRRPPAPPSPTPTAPTAVAGLRSSPFPRAELSCRCLSCGSASAVPGGLRGEGSLS